jgi:hypothetical protein
MELTKSIPLPCHESVRQVVRVDDQRPGTIEFARAESNALVSADHKCNLHHSPSAG